jgi:hypothetical protein
LASVRAVFTTYLLVAFGGVAYFVVIGLAHH